MIVKLWAIVAGAEAGSALIAAANGISGATFIQLALALLGGGAGASYISGRHRRKSGEDRSTAAEDVAHGATEMAGAIKDLLQPLREEQARLRLVVLEKQNRLLEKTEELATAKVALANCEAAFEKRRHADASELAALAAHLESAHVQLATAQERNETLEVMLGLAPERRDGDRREDDQPDT